MADEEKNANTSADAEDSADKPAEENATAPKGRIRRFAKKRWGLLTVVGVLVVHTSVLWYLAAASAGSTDASGEVSLGSFEFVNYATEQLIRHAQFELHLSLLEDVDHAARERLTARRFRVQQDVEQLLRQAHGADFADPQLTELKRRLQEQVNESLGMRAVSDVLITDLSLEVVDGAGPVGENGDASANAG